MTNFKKLNEENKMTKRPAQDEPEDRATTIEPSQTWINKTRSGKGFIIHIKDDFKKEDVLLGSLNALQEFVDGDRNGINLGILTEIED